MEEIEGTAFFGGGEEVRRGERQGRLFALVLSAEEDGRLTRSVGSVVVILPVEDDGWVKRFFGGIGATDWCFDSVGQ